MTSSCRTFLAVPLKISAGDPHAMENDGKYSGNGNGGLAMTLGLHEFESPGLQCRGVLVTREQGAGGDIERTAWRFATQAIS